MSHRWTSLVVAALFSGLAIWSVPAASAAAASARVVHAAPRVNAQDTLIFKNGRTLVGTIVSESPTTIRFKGEVNGIALDTEFDRSEILRIVRGAATTPDRAPAPATDPAPLAAADPVKPPSAPTVADDPTGKKRVYLIELTGAFGRDISETPLRESLRDAQRLGADIVVLSLQADWKFQGGDAGDDVTNFDALFRAEKIGPVISDEIELWPKAPRVVVWVKKAMGGAAFLPFYSRDIYFSSDGRMGGIGFLKQLMEGVGDEVVREKQYSLRLGHARGVANKHGYAYQIINAMVVKEYVLSAKIEGGRVTYFERMPEGPDEILLTDDGEDERADLLKDVVAGEGNDVLTLNAKLARDLGLSKGTVDTLEDLLIEMGHSRDWSEIKDGRARQILSRWSSDLTSAMRDLRVRIPQRLAEINPGGTFQERTRARGQRKRILQEMQGLFRKYQEVFGEDAAAQEISNLSTQIELLDQEQQRDAQEQRRR
ncbi:MAG: hypothetical protein KF787_09395 [Phycisphaeraceae bacterium]|nr:hypothetical protein [Phycisphaeraceae bacterium]